MRKRWLIIPLLLIVVATNAQEDTNQIPMIGEDITNTEITTNTLPEPIETMELTNDSASNMVEQTNTSSQYVDTVGYTVQYGEVLYASPMARFEVKGVDDQSGLKSIMVSLDGGIYAPYKAPVSFSTEGTHTISYQFIDSVGNISYSQTFEVIIDATPTRVLNIIIDPMPYHASGYKYAGPNSSISFLAHDDGTGVAYIEYSTNKQDFIHYNSNFTLGEIGATNTGILELSYQATDMVSNVSLLKTETLFIDALAPTVNIFATVFEKDGIRYISSKDIISVEAFDADTEVAQIYYAINEGEFQIYNKEIGINLKEAGEYDVRAKAVDVVGNESKEIVYSVVVDMLPPTGNALYIGAEKSANYKETLGSIEEPTQYTEESATSTTEEAQPMESTEQVIEPIEQNVESTEQNTEPSTDDLSKSSSTSEEVPAGAIAPATE